MRIGLLHPGEMGAAVGVALRTRGHEVLWVAAGRSAASAERAHHAGLQAADSPAELAAQAQLVLSTCSPHAALRRRASCPASTASTSMPTRSHPEWQQSQPQLPEQLAHAQRAAMAKGWRWAGEMQEIADFFASVDEPEGFHRAAADVYRKFPR